MYAGDSASGSHSEYSAPWGLDPESHKVPSVSHWHDDRVPYDNCCGFQRPPAGNDENSDQHTWSTDFAHDCLDVYATARPTIDCKKYTPPGQGNQTVSLRTAVMRLSDHAVISLRHSLLSRACD